MVTIIKKKALRATKQKLEKILQQRRTTIAKHNWYKFFGKVTFSDDAVNYQRKLRDE